MTGISAIGLQLSTASLLQSQMTELDTLNQQLASGVKSSDLTDYSPSDAQNLLNYQNAITQRQSYLSSIDTVQARLSVYDSTMTDMESLTQTAQTLAAQNTTYSADTASEIQGQVGNYLTQIQDDLNQQVNGRYIYSGSRYNTAPVSNLSSSSTTVTYPFTATTSPAVPSYDSSYVSGLNVSTTGQTVTFSGSVATPQNASVTVNGKVYSYAIQSGDTTTSIASGLATLIDTDIPGTTSSNGVLTVGSSGAISSATGNSSTSAFSQDSVTVDTGYSAQYGVTSNATGFQQLIAGLKLMQQASSQTDPTTYQTDMNNAATLLTTALGSIQALHTGVAANINLMTQETTTQNSDITNLQDQITGIDYADPTTVSTEITSLQAQLEASYSATGSILKLSLVNYL